jgi:hypothetical protein
MANFSTTIKFVADIKSEVAYLIRKMGDVTFRESPSENFYLPNEERIIDEIAGYKNQDNFDVAKRLLNQISLDDLYNTYNNDNINDGVHIQISFTYKDIIERCGRLRECIYIMMNAYKLKNNNPKNGFLCPYDLEDIHEEDVAGEQNEKSKGEALKEVRFKIPENLKLEEVYDFLDKEGIFKEPVTQEEFTEAVTKGDFSSIYNKSKKSNLRYVIDGLRTFFDNKHDKKWSTRACQSMGITDITKYNATPKFKDKVDELISEF